MFFDEERRINSGCLPLHALRRSLLWVPILAFALGLGACRRHGEEQANLKAGESLFDLLDQASVISYPATNLPEEAVRLLKESFKLRSRALRAEEWEWVDNSTIPSWIRRVNAQYGGLTYRATTSPIPLSLMTDSVRVYIQGEECRPWRMDSADFPGVIAWWDRRDRLLFSLSSSLPEGVSVQCLCVPEPEMEPTGLFQFPSGPGQRNPKPLPPELVRNVEMGRVSRRSIMLPAPGIISFPIERLRCDELRFAAGVIDQGYKVIGTDLEQSNGMSDGVTVLVWVVSDGQASVVWQDEIAHHELGYWRPEVSIDLSRYSGKRITLQLATEPGANGNADYDYAVWGSLRLYGKPEKEPERPHLVLIDIDTLRKDRLGCYGYQRDTSPNMDRWAAERAVVYTNCQATAPWTLPSTVSMLSGLSVDQHRIDRFPSNMEMRVPSLALVLGDSGYETFGIAEGGYVAGSYGLDLGFDVYDCTLRDNPDWSKALSWIRSRRSEKPFFLFCQTYLVHAPYFHDTRFQDGERPYAGRWAGQDITYQNVITPFNSGELQLTESDMLYINALYDAGVFQMDRYVGSFIDSITALMGNHRYAIFFTSDHGEEFLEHGKMGHGQSLFRELLDVPLIVQFPRRSSGWKSGVIEEPVSTLDIMPTMLALAGIQVPSEYPGHSLLHTLPKEAIRIARQTSRIRSITVGNHKLIVDDDPRSGRPLRRLYDLVEDPAEEVNLASSQAELAEKLARLLRRHIRDGHMPLASDSVAAIRTKTSNRLRALGYLQ